MAVISNEDIFEFCRAYDWKKKIGQLENMAIKERWYFLKPQENAKNTTNPILENYIKHTFKRLFHLIEKNDKYEADHISQENEYMCFNAGLFTEHYEKIFFLLKYEKKEEDKKEWSFDDFVKESDYRLFDFELLPKKISFIEKIEDLIFDTSLDLRINSSHILSDPKNVERLPDKLQNASNLSVLFDGAIVQVQKKIEANYKIAVPQYYNGKTQFLLPICLEEPEKVDVVLAVEKKKNSYAGRTCLTLDMAYNNARLIAKPETPWLTNGV